ncbi:MAG: hypothetical protein IPK82_04695 [Polyangiaceae bacterium]|nr:hypothetical protein [Polyangiaceae bacterium]
MIARFTFASLAMGAVIGACGSGDGVYELDIDEDGSESAWGLTEASGLAITQVAMYQGVKAVLMENGAPGAGSVQIIAGRDALMRVFIAADPNFNNEPIVGRLYIDGVKDPIEVKGPAPVLPVESDLLSTLNFQIPGALITPTFSYRVELLQPRGQSKGTNPAARYPAQATAPVGVTNVGTQLRITIVPFRYNGDGSGRLPDTSEATIQGYKDYFYGMYPTPLVEITVREPVDYSGDVSPNGFGWDKILGYLGQVRSQDQAPFDVYYYGIFAPANSIGQFCGGGCVAGLGNIGGPGDAYSRAAVGLGFENDSVASWETAVHEIGHTHGRFHSPCGGAQGTDPGYPYSGGKIGVWGYSLPKQQLFAPEAKDVMGYCYPIWISDFTYNALADRVKAVNELTMMRKITPPEKLNLTYERATIDGEGNLEFLPSLPLEMPPEANPMVVQIKTDDEDQQAEAHFYPYDHLPGGVILWPQAKKPSMSVAFEWNGQVKTFVRQ